MDVWVQNQKIKCSSRIRSFSPSVAELAGEDAEARPAPNGHRSVGSKQLDWFVHWLDDSHDHYSALTLISVWSSSRFSSSSFGSSSWLSLSFSSISVVVSMLLLAEEKERERSLERWPADGLDCKSLRDRTTACAYLFDIKFLATNLHWCGFATFDETSGCLNMQPGFLHIAP